MHFILPAVNSLLNTFYASMSIRCHSILNYETVQSISAFRVSTNHISLLICLLHIAALSMQKGCHYTVQLLLHNQVHIRTHTLLYSISLLKSFHLLGQLLSEYTQLILLFHSFTYLIASYCHYRSLPFPYSSILVADLCATYYYNLIQNQTFSYFTKYILK